MPDSVDDENPNALKILLVSPDEPMPYEPKFAAVPSPALKVRAPVVLSMDAVKLERVLAELVPAVVVLAYRVDAE